MFVERARLDNTPALLPKKRFDTFTRFKEIIYFLPQALEVLWGSLFAFFELKKLL